MHFSQRLAFPLLSACAALPALLAWPPADPPAPEGSSAQPFAWNQDLLWERLETDWSAARETGCTAEAPGETPFAVELAELEAALAALEAWDRAPDDPLFESLEERFFHAVAEAGSCPDRVASLMDRYERLRWVLKERSFGWEMQQPAARERLYRLVFGGRAALEELLLQLPPEAAPALGLGPAEPSRTPATEVHGVRIHSGDLLLSRGGAPTSALIARGNRFPGNFSHVALAHVAEDGTGSVIEAHIERGTVVSTVEQYLADKKLRILVLRPRADLPALRDDPLLPHRAATTALDEARAGPIPYDFAMDPLDHRARFCSEVAAAAYEGAGIQLWPAPSELAGRGVAAWLGSLGVRHFETQAPSDLEYDPQLRVVAEFRDPAALWDDHLDNAVIDALLEQADRGLPLGWNRAQLLPARMAKAWSWLLNQLDLVGPVPEGMDAVTALRVRWLRARHAEIKASLGARAETWRREHGYRPPYWDLVQLAREAAED